VGRARGPRSEAEGKGQDGPQQPGLRFKPPTQRRQAPRKRQGEARSGSPIPHPRPHPQEREARERTRKIAKRASAPYFEQYP